MSATTTEPSALVAGQVDVVAVQRLSPSFVRVELGGDLLDQWHARAGFDTRFKLVLPGDEAGGLVPALDGVCFVEWFEAWRSMPPGRRSPMRTYTVRALLSRPTRLVVDLVVHDDEPSPTTPGSGLGPAARWALRATVGDRVGVVGPHRDGEAHVGREFLPGSRRDLLLAGDETALPAIAGILRDATAEYTGRVFIEVPDAADRQPLPPRAGLSVTWLVRGPSRAPGVRLVHAVRSVLGLPALTDHTVLPALSALRSVGDVEVWETPAFSSSGEAPVESPKTAGSGGELSESFVWVAGESSMVKALRRSVITELRVPRAQTASMGYWRRGVAMSS